MAPSSKGSGASGGVSRRRFIETAGATGVALTVAGCGGGSAGEGTIVIMGDDPLVKAQDPIVEALSEAGLDDNIEIDIEAEEFESDSRQNDFSSRLRAERSSPDIFMMDSGWTIPFIVRGQLVNLSEKLSDDTVSYVKSDYLDASVKTASHPETGDLYGLPLYPDYPVMHYRKDLVEQAGYDPEGENWATEAMTWQEFAQVAADAWEESDAEYGFVTQAAEYGGTSCCTFNEMMTSWGGAYFGDHDNLFGPVGDRPITVDEQPVYDTIRMMRSFMEGPDAENAHPDFPKIANTDLVEFTEKETHQAFRDGDAVFMRNWPYAININHEDGVFDPSAYDVMPMPYAVEEGEGNYAGTGGPSHALGGWHLTVNPYGSNVDDSVKVVEAFANKNVMATILEEMTNLPPDPSVAEEADPDSVGAIGDYLDTLAVAGQNTVPRPVTAIWPDESPVIAKEVHSAYKGEKSPEDAMADLVDELEDYEESK